MDIELVVLALGCAGGLVSGLLGLGGGILMAPALLYVPPLLGVRAFDMKQVTGLTIVQGLVACLFGAFRHGRYGCVSRRLVLAMSPPVVVGALAGSVASRWVGSQSLMLLLALLAALGAALLWLPKREDEDAAGEPAFDVRLAVVLALGAGLLCGAVGQGGSFLFVPLMLHVLRLPTRVVIGSNLVLVIFSSAAGFAGKLATAQVQLLPAAMLALGTVPGTQLGGVLSHRTRTRSLRAALGAVVSACAVILAVDALRP